MPGMRRVIRWAPGAGVLALLLLMVGVAGAAAPAGPRFAFVKETWSPLRVTLLTVDPDGNAPRRLAGGQDNGPVEGFGRLSWRPDGSGIAFPGIGSIFLAKADGSGAHELNIANAERPVFAPNGHTLAFTRFTGVEEAEIWTVDLTSGAQRQLTPSRRGLEYVSSSFSPDGTTLLATRLDARRNRRPELMALHLDTGGVSRLLGNGFAPVYSPDGSRISVFREVGHRPTSDLFVLDVASGSLRRLTRTPNKEELFASWDPSGERLVFARFPRRRFESPNSIVQINADGTCETEVLSQKRTVFYAPAWQPGAGREAGPIAC